MTTYYCDPAAAGTNDGTSWTNAWQTLQRAIDGTGGTKPNAGDVVLCRGTETVTVMIDSDGNSGTGAGGFVTFRGVNSSGVDDGTRYVLDSTGTLTGIINLSADLVMFENMELRDNTGHGFRVAAYSACDNNTFINCYAHDNTGSGFDNNVQNGMRYAKFIRCRFESNGAAGAAKVADSVFIHCAFKGNTGNGIDTGSFGHIGIMIIECQVTGNGGKGIDILSGTGPFSVIYQTVVDGNTGDGIENNTCIPIYGCRVTENAIGIDNNSATVIAHTYMPASGQARDNSTSNIDTAGGPYYDPPIDGVATNNLAGTDANGGYENPTTDFSLASGAALRNQEIPLDANTSVYIAAGLSPSAAGGGGSVIILED